MLENNHDLSTAIQAVRDGLGWVVLSQYALIEVVGTDAQSYLQAQSTSDVTQLAVGDSQLSAFIDRKAHIQSVFTLYRQAEETYWLLLETPLLASTLERLERYVFTESLTFRERDDVTLQLVMGTAAPSYVAQYASECNVIPVVPVVMGTEPAYVVCGENSPLLPAEAVPLSDAALDVLRLEAGLPRFGLDYDSETLLPATGLEQRAVSYTKGCYQGQEVVAKVRTYGSVGHTLQGLIVESPLSEGLLHAPLLLDGNPVGVLKSYAFSPSLGKTIALAMLNREVRTPGRELGLEINGTAYAATVSLLPFVTTTSAQEKARACYERALEEFTNGDEAKAEPLLRQAIALDAKLADAYEVLGVILSRQDKLDEAIALMKRLNELNPDEVMAHANLSQFYAKKGLIEEAETEKAKATMLSFRLAMSKTAPSHGASDKASLDNAIEDARRKDLEQKIAMFTEVLDYDPEDGLANYGKGQALLDLARYGEAEPYLQKAIVVQKNHTMSYLALGKTLQALSKPDEAKAIFEQGILVATRKGDLMPLKEMQARLG